MDFIERLPHMHGKSVILSVVDWFSKAAAFPLGILIQLHQSHAFFNEIVRLHGMTESIVSYRDPD
jgi:hypothetical protein